MAELKTFSLFVALLLTACVTAGFITGCGAGNESAKAGNTIDYFSMWSVEEAHAEYLKQMSLEFEKETGIKVNLVFSDRDVLTKTKGRFLMGNPPDLIDQEFCELTSSITIGTFKPADLTDMFYEEKEPEGQERLIDIFGEGRINLYKKDGMLCLFPYEFITSGFFYDINMFDKYGLKAPVKWDDFIRNSESLNENNISPLALDGSIPFYNSYYFCWSVERVLGPGAFRDAASDTSGSAWDNPGYLKAAELVYDLSKAKRNYFQKDYKKSEWPTAQTEWAEGKHGNILCSSWVPNETKRYTKSGFIFGFYPFPEIQGGKGRISDVEVGFIGCAIPKDSKKINQAKAFLRFLVKRENAQKFVQKTNNISARLDIEYPEVLAAVKEYTANAESLYMMYDGVWADMPEWWANVFLPLDNRLIYGELTPKDFIDQIKKNSIMFWNQR